MPTSFGSFRPTKASELVRSRVTFVGRVLLPVGVLDGQEPIVRVSAPLAGSRILYKETLGQA